MSAGAIMDSQTLGNRYKQIKLAKILQKLAESERKAFPKHQMERWINILLQTIKLQVIS